VALTLFPTDIDSESRWRWVLLDDLGRTRLTSEVDLDPEAPEYRAFADLPAHLLSDPPPTGRISYEAQRARWLGDWIGRQVLGEPLWPALKNSIVVVRTDQRGAFLSTRPLELAIIDGRPLARHGTVLVHDRDLAAEIPAWSAAKEPVGRTVRMLAVFAQPTSMPRLDLRRERWELQRSVRRLAAGSGKRVDVRVLEYGVTRKLLSDTAAEAPGWDVLHISGHGAGGSVSLEKSDGSEDRLPAADFVQLLRPTGERLKCAVLSTCHSAAGVSGLVDELRRELDVAVLAMRFPIRDGFAVALTRQLYHRLFVSGQPLERAVRLAVPEAAGNHPDVQRPPLSIGTPALFGRTSIGLTLAPEQGEIPDDIDPWIGSGVPPLPVEFVGRTGVLQSANRALALDSGRTGVLFHAADSIGKTWCATELAYGQSGRFGRLAWWSPRPAADPQEHLTDLAWVLQRDLGWPVTWAAATGREFDDLVGELSHKLRSGRTLLVLDGLHAVMTEQGRWIDARLGRVITRWCEHGGDSRLVLTSRRPLPDLPPAVERCHLRRLSIAELSLRGQGTARLAPLLAEVDRYADAAADDETIAAKLSPDATALLRLLQKWPRLIGPVMAEPPDPERVARVAADLPEPDRRALRDSLANADATPENPEPGHAPAGVISDALREVETETLTDALRDLDIADRPDSTGSEAGADVEAVVARSIREGWVRHLVRLLMDRDPRLRTAYDDLLTRQAEAPVDGGPGNRLVVAVTGAPEADAFIAEVHARLADSPLPVQPWLGDEAAAPTDAVDLHLLTSDVLLFVLTAAGAAPDSPCRTEVEQALAVDKPVIGLIAERGVGRPGWAPGLDTVDCTSDDNSGWTTLDRRLHSETRPERTVNALIQRRDRLRHETGDRGPAARGAGLVDDLERQIILAESQIGDPAGAGKRKADAIEVGKVRDRRTDRPMHDGSGIRVYNVPPTVPEAEFKDRDPYLRRLGQLLADRSIGMVAILGAAGIGKTGMIAQFLAEAPTRPATARPDGFAYLPIRGAQAISSFTLLESLVHMVAAPEPAERLAARLARSSRRLDLLDDVLDQLTTATVVLVLDNAEEVIEDGRFDTPDLQAMVDRIVERRDHGVRLVLIMRTSTGQLPPLPTGTWPLLIDEGLPVDDARDFLLAMDGGRLAGLTDELTTHLDELHRRTGGSPRALELAYGHLLSGGAPTLEALVRTLAGVRPAQVVESLLRLTLKGCHLYDRRRIQALAIYGRPVEPGAVDVLLQGHLQGGGTAGRLDALCRRRIVRRDHQGRYYLPPEPDRECVLRTIPPRGTPGPGAGGSGYHRPALFARAADYFAEVAVLDDEVTGVQDLRTRLIEIELRLRAEQYRPALKLIEDLDEHHLHPRGQSAVLVGFLERDLRDRLTNDPEAEVRRLGLLIRAYRQMGDHAKVEALAHPALALAHTLGENDTEARTLIYLGSSRLQIGETAAARRSYRLALRRLGWVRRRESPVPLASIRIGLALCDTREARFDRAPRHLRAAGALLESARREPGADAAEIREIDQMRANVMANRGQIHAYLKEYDTAHDRYRAARRIAETNGLLLMVGEIRRLESELLIDQRRFGDAVQPAADAARIGMEAGDHELSRTAHEALTLARLCQPEQLDAATESLRGIRHGRSAYTFAFEGLVAFRRGDLRAAAKLFDDAQSSIDPHRRPAGDRDFTLLELTGVVQAGRALAADRRDLADVACATFRRTRREVTRAPGVVERTRLLLDQFSENGDPAMLAQIRAASESQLNG
jgi:tetratricopeptide (TPR) repeat protein